MAKKGTGRRGRKAEQARKRRQQTMWVLGVVVVAVLIAGVMIVLSLVDGDEGATSVPPPVEGTESGLTADGYPYLGSPDAPVKMIEYSDYFCGHCGQFNADKAPQIEEEYVATGKVQFIVPYYALGKDARLVVVEASACAADQGRFFEYRRLLFANSRELAETPQPSGNPCWSSMPSRSVWTRRLLRAVGIKGNTREKSWPPSTKRFKRV